MNSVLVQIPVPKCLLKRIHIIERKFGMQDYITSWAALNYGSKIDLKQKKSHELGIAQVHFEFTTSLH